jgi:hypothetical protein
LETFKRKRRKSPRKKGYFVHRKSNYPLPILGGNTHEIENHQSKNASSLYVIKSNYKDGKNSSKIVEKLGTYAELSERLAAKIPSNGESIYCPTE